MLLIFSYEAKKPLSIIWDKLFKKKTMLWISFSLNNNIQVALVCFFFSILYATQAIGSSGTVVSRLCWPQSNNSHQATNFFISCSWELPLRARQETTVVEKTWETSSCDELRVTLQVLHWQNLRAELCWGESQKNSHALWHPQLQHQTQNLQTPRTHFYLARMQLRIAHRHAQHYVYPKINRNINRILSELKRQNFIGAGLRKNQVVASSGFL